MAEPEGTIHHVGLTVTDLNLAERFYKDGLGLAEVYRKSWGPEDGRMDAILETAGSSGRILFLTDGRMGVELFEFTTPCRTFSEPQYATELGWMHIALEVQDIDAACARLAASGMSFKHPPSIGESGNAATYGRDPFGNLIEIVQYGATRKK